MKSFLFTPFILIFIISGYSQSPIEIKILNSKIKNNTKINIEIKNNTNKKIYFIIDTSKNETKYFNENFINPIVFLIDSKGKYLPLVKKIKTCEEENDKHLKSEKPIFFPINPYQSTKLNIPFSLSNVNSESIYYNVKQKSKYRAIIRYKINKEFINKMFSKATLDSIKNNGCEIFKGSLKSNEVPLMF